MAGRPNPIGARYRTCSSTRSLNWPASRLATICAGRTDAGVHALDQIVHFDTAVERSALQAWVRGTNRFLPAGVAVRWSRTVPDEFHARFSSPPTDYDYWILNAPVRSPLAHNAPAGCFVLWMNE